MTKRGRSEFERRPTNVQVFANGVVHEILHVEDWKLSEIQCKFNPENVMYFITFYCEGMEQTVRCFDENEQILLASALSNL
jgi:hypothetical protein